MDFPIIFDDETQSEHSQFVTNIVDRSVDGDDIARNCPVSVDLVQLVVALDVLGFGELESLALLARSFARLFKVDVRVIVPIDLLPKYVVLLLEERIGRLHVMEFILGN
jgi:hypothetical protein